MFEKIRRVVRVYLRKSTSSDMILHLKKKGVKVGSHTYFFAPSYTTVDTQRPWLLEIGDYCKITQGVVILAHDYSRSVLRRVYGEIVAEAQKTIIGDNVFIGINSIILMGSHIGNNVIIGAGSVVHGNIPDNTVVAGDPARVLCTLDDYYKNRKSKYKDEAISCAREFFTQNKRKPSIEEMGAFFPLYLDRSKEAIERNHINLHLNGDDEDSIYVDFLKTEPEYKSYEAFLYDVFEKNKY